MPVGVVGEAGAARRPLLAPPEADRSPTSLASAGEAGTIEIALPNGVRICVAVYARAPAYILHSIFRQ